MKEKKKCTICKNPFRPFNERQMVCNKADCKIKQAARYASRSRQKYKKKIEKKERDKILKLISKRVEEANDSLKSAKKLRDNFNIIKSRGKWEALTQLRKEISEMKHNDG